MNKKKFKAPARIYLLPPLRNEDVMWCEDRIGDVDVEYVRADIAKRENRRLEKIIDVYKGLIEIDNKRKLFVAYFRGTLLSEARSSINLDRDQTQCEQEQKK